MSKYNFSDAAVRGAWRALNDVTCRSLGLGTTDNDAMRASLEAGAAELIAENERLKHYVDQAGQKVDDMRRQREAADIRAEAAEAKLAQYEAVVSAAQKHAGGMSPLFVSKLRAQLADLPNVSDSRKFALLDLIDALAALEERKDG